MNVHTVHMQENFGSKKLQWRISLTGSLVGKNFVIITIYNDDTRSHMNKDSSLKNACIAMHTN